MTSKTPPPRFRILLVSALASASGVVGSFVGRAYGSALSTSPPWVGPAILIGSLMLIVVGLLLLPAGIRAYRAANR